MAGDFYGFVVVFRVVVRLSCSRSKERFHRPGGFIENRLSETILAVPGQLPQMSS